jgi:hypothetical protein
MTSGCTVPARRIISNGVAELMILTVLPSVPVRVIDPTIMEKAVIQSEGAVTHQDLCAARLARLSRGRGGAPTGREIAGRTAATGWHDEEQAPRQETVIALRRDATAMASLTEEIINPPQVFTLLFQRKSKKSKV